ncbi:MAG TPA: hypothetical protein ENN30_01540 [Candidatus Woesearchaeota archaeon]|nr:hypothetical protein [Candidatus Woesearchaeota archaeon]
MVEFQTDAEKIAEMALGIGAITLSPEDPYTWASGYRMPIYNDNRKHLSFSKNRSFIAHTLMLPILREVEGFAMQKQYISGTSTSGIAPGYSVAQLVGLPFIFQNKNEVFMINPNDIEFEFSQRDRTFYDAGIYEVDSVSSTCPFAIPFGVHLANRQDLPFSYVRQKSKDHGLEQQIEGVISQGEHVLLVDIAGKDSYADNARQALIYAGAGEVSILSLDSSLYKNVTNSLSNKFLIEKRGELQEYETNTSIIQIEDLVSTGGSTVKEMDRYKELGADVSKCFSIFSFGFPEAEAEFEKRGYTLSPVLDYDTLIKVAKQKGTITDEQFEMLKDWRKDAWNWGEKHGFPKVVKK